MRKPWTPFWRVLPYEVLGRFWIWRSRRKLQREGWYDREPPPDVTVNEDGNLRVTSWVER